FSLSNHQPWQITLLCVLVIWKRLCRAVSMSLRNATKLLQTNCTLGLSQRQRTKSLKVPMLALMPAQSKTATLKNGAVRDWFLQGFLRQSLPQKIGLSREMGLLHGDTSSRLPATHNDIAALMHNDYLRDVYCEFHASAADLTLTRKFYADRASALSAAADSPCYRL